MDAMEHIESAHIAVDKYFEVLSRIGFFSEKRTRKLLVYSFLVDAILEGPLQEYLDDEGLSAVQSILECLAKDMCLSFIPSDYVRLSSPRGAATSLRITEDGILRHTEVVSGDTTRITERGGFTPEQWKIVDDDKVDPSMQDTTEQEDMSGNGGD